MKNVFSTPVYNKLQLENHMKFLQIPEGDMKKPTSDYVKSVYSKFVEIIFNIDSKENEIPQFTEEEIFQYKELHENSTKFVEYFKKLKFLLNSVGIDDFSIKDLIFPEEKRFKAHLSSLINFATFREQKLQIYIDNQENYQKYLEKERDLEDEHNTVTTKVMIVRKNRNLEEPDIEQRKRDNLENSKELRILQNLQNKLTNENELENKKYSEIENKNVIFLYIK
jgi:kinetochore protein Nuf2